MKGYGWASPYHDTWRERVQAIERAKAEEQRQRRIRAVILGAVVLLWILVFRAGFETTNGRRSDGSHGEARGLKAAVDVPTGDDRPSDRSSSQREGSR